MKKKLNFTIGSMLVVFVLIVCMIVGIPNNAKKEQESNNFIPNGYQMPMSIEASLERLQYDAVYQSNKIIAKYNEDTTSAVKLFADIPISKRDTIVFLLADKIFLLEERDSLQRVKKQLLQKLEKAKNQQ